MTDASLEIAKYKISVIGNQLTGKTSLITQYTNATFDRHYQETICLDFKTKNLKLANRTLKLQIWDTSGQERFGSFMSGHLNNTALALIVFDVTEKGSFEAIPNWIAKARASNSERPIILAANKTDFNHDKPRVISTEMIEALARSNNLYFIETSAKTACNTELLFRACAALVSLDKAHQPAPLTYQIVSDTFAEKSVAKKDSVVPAYPALEQQLSKLLDDYPDVIPVQSIVSILRAGLATTNPNAYFTDLLEADPANLPEDCNLKCQINHLAWTHPSLCNTLLNVFVTILLTLSVIGLPLMYCLSVLEANKKASGHSLMFFAFGEKQRAMSVSNHVFAEVSVTNRV